MCIRDRDEEKKARLAELNRVLEQTGQPLHEAYLGREVEDVYKRQRLGWAW